MKRWFARAAAIVLFAGAVVALVGAPARSACTTQGDLAVALAQLIGLVGAGAAPELAAAKLSEKGVRPDPDWDLDACLDEPTIAEIERALQAAIAAGAIDQQYANAVADAQSIADQGGPGGGPGGVGAGVPDAGKSRNPPVSPHQPQ